MERQTEWHSINRSHQLRMASTSIQYPPPSNLPSVQWGESHVHVLGTPVGMGGVYKSQSGLNRHSRLKDCFESVEFEKPDIRSMPMFKVNAAWAAMTEVVPNLYICGVSALKPTAILAMNFDLIINATREVPNMALPPDVERLKLWLDDTEETDLASHLDIAVDYIKMILEVDGRVLVHCVAGVSRSAAVCLAYLVKYESMSLRQAYQHMAIRRPRVRPNLGFWRQLIDFEIELRGQTSVVIKKYQDDQELPDVYECVMDGEMDIPPLADQSNHTPSKSATSEKREERKRQRQLSDAENGKRYVPKLAPLLEVEQ